MNIKTSMKIILSCILVPITALGLLILTLYVFPNTIGLILGLLLSGSFFTLVIIYGYPVWFKDYIKEYWKKQEEKEEENDKKKKK